MNIKNKKILISGGTGQIGSFLCEKLVECGSKVILIGRSTKNLEEKKILENSSVEFVPFDILSSEDENVFKKIEKVDFFIHLISNINPSKTNVFEDVINSIEINMDIVPKLLKKLTILKGICYVSSVAVYGKPKYLPIDENCPTNPITSYGCGKLGGEKLLKIYCTDNSIPLTILRMVPVYGPRNRSTQVIPTFIKKALHNEKIHLTGIKNRFRDFIYVTDAVDSIIASIERNETDVYNIGSGVKIKINEIAEKIISIIKSESIITKFYRKTDFDSILDISKAENKLGFKPKTCLDEGLKYEIEWHKKINDTKMVN